MTFIQAIKSCYSNYATFSGRAARSEYWYFTLYHFIIVMLCIATAPLGTSNLLLVISFVVNFLPAISVVVRRLHDTDHSGWWYWIALVPLVGVVLLLIWFCTRGTSGANRFGPDPLSAMD